VAAELWLAEVQRLRAGTTFDTYRRYLASRALPAFGELRLRECTAPMAHRYLRALEEELEANTVRSCRSVVSGILGFAVQQGAIPSNPVRDDGRIEGGGVAVRALTGEERVEFLARLDADERAAADELPDLIRFMLGTGVRIGEALALRWGQVDLDAREALVGPTLSRVTGKGLFVNERGKTRSALRMVPLPDFVQMMLQLRLPPAAAR
jgi:integrase